MADHSFTRYGAVVLIALALVGVVAVLWLLARRKLTMTYAIVWTFSFVGLALLVFAPPLLDLAVRALGTREPGGAVRLLAMITVVAFLLFFSARLSMLTDRVDDLVQKVALIEFSLREELEQKTTEQRTRDH